LPHKHDLRLAWLELFSKNPYCLQGVKKLWIYHYSPLEVDVVEIIEKVRTLVDNVEVIFLW
jgi:hypothetical protein